VKEFIHAVDNGWKWCVGQLSFGYKDG